MYPRQVSRGARKRACPVGKGAVPERGLLPAGFFSYLKPGDRDAIREAGENPAQGVAERLQPVRAGEAAASNGRRRGGVPYKEIISLYKATANNGRGRGAKAAS